MLREDRELLAELAQLNRAMAALAMRIIEGSATRAEQRDYGQRLIAAGQDLQRRAEQAPGPVIEGDVASDPPIALPANTIEPDREP